MGLFPSLDLNISQFNVGYVFLTSAVVPLSIVIRNVSGPCYSVLAHKKVGGLSQGSLLALFTSFGGPQRIGLAAAGDRLWGQTRSEKT